MNFNKRICILFILVMLTAIDLEAQKFISDKTFISFYSHATIEDIKAGNQKGSALFDAGTGEIAFVVPTKEFEFAKSLMKEHFNEKYMDTERYPKSTFQGKIKGYDASISTEQSVIATGKLIIHGVARDVEIPGKISKVGESLSMTSTFIVKLEDYKIKIPQLMWQNIAEQVEVTMTFSFKPKT